MCTGLSPLQTASTPKVIRRCTPSAWHSVWDKDTHVVLLNACLLKYTGAGDSAPSRSAGLMVRDPGTRTPVPPTVRDPGTRTPVPLRRRLGPSQPWPARAEAAPRVQAEAPAVPRRRPLRGPAQKPNERRQARAREPQLPPPHDRTQTPGGSSEAAPGGRRPRRPTAPLPGQPHTLRSAAPRPAGSARPTWRRLRGSGRAMSAPSAPSPDRGLVHLHFCLRGPLGVDQQVIENRLLLALRGAWDDSRRGLGGRHARRRPSRGRGATTAAREGQAAPAAAALKSQGRGWG